jgi:uncharacterized protein
MRVIGIDLSGPSNHKDTVLSLFKKQDSELLFLKLMRNVSDFDILEEIRVQSEIDEVIIGIDAPLSYKDGGGDRQGDKLLRSLLFPWG